MRTRYNLIMIQVLFKRRKKKREKCYKLMIRGEKMEAGEGNNL